MEIQASPAQARTGPAGESILLLEQDRSRWDRVLIRLRSYHLLPSVRGDLLLLLERARGCERP